MNKILSACGLESRPRWIDMGAIKGHRYNYSCSCCGEKIHRRILPKICPNCKCEMKPSQRELGNVELSDADMDTLAFMLEGGE